MKFIRDILNDNEAALIFLPENRRYLTGFNSSLGYYLITKSTDCLFVDGRYYSAAKSGASAGSIVLLKNIAEQLKNLLEEHKVERMLVERENRYCDIDVFKRLPISVVVSERLSDSLKKARAIKSEAEVANIKSALKIAEQALEATLPFIKAGRTEIEVAAFLEYEMRKRGSEETAFKTICLTGAKTALPHGEPDQTVIKDGDAVLIDFGATVNGYRSDITRTFCVGSCSDEFKAAYEAVRRAGEAGFCQLAGGCPLKIADEAAREAFGEYEPYFTHSLGHGVGLDIHEAPTLSYKAEGYLAEGNIVTVEPGVYFDGKFGIRIEDMAYIEKNGARNLTQFSKNLTILA